MSSVSALFSVCSRQWLLIVVALKVLYMRGFCGGSPLHTLPSLLPRFNPFPKLLFLPLYISCHPPFSLGLIAGYTSTASDVFAAGVILYILLCGYPPFNSKSVRQLFVRTVKGKERSDNAVWLYMPLFVWLFYISGQIKQRTELGNGTLRVHAD